MKWEISYYFNEGAKKSKCAAFKETISSNDKNFVVKWAENKLKQNSNFKLYEIKQV